MTIFLQNPELEKLAKICGLFSSAHPGERAGAAAKADEIVRALGTTWFDLIVTRWNSKQKGEWAETVESKLGAVLATPDPLTDWEREFAQSISGRRTLSVKQGAVLDRLYKKVQAYYQAKGRTT